MRPRPLPTPPGRSRAPAPSSAPAPFERRFRDIRTVMQQAQGRKTHLQDVGAYIMGLEPNLAFA